MPAFLSASCKVGWGRARVAGGRAGGRRVTTEAGRVGGGGVVVWGAGGGCAARAAQARDWLRHGTPCTGRRWCSAACPEGEGHAPWVPGWLAQPQARQPRSSHPQVPRAGGARPMGPQPLVLCKYYLIFIYLSPACRDGATHPLGHQAADEAWVHWRTPHGLTTAVLQRDVGVRDCGRDRGG